MTRILTVDCSTNFAFVSLSENGVAILTRHNETQKEHAAFIHIAIKELCETYGSQLNDFDGFAVVDGPGSYTGLRVAMAAVKGLCYSLKKPLICMHSLELIAMEIKNKDQMNSALFVPMIDARRMEVFTALYNSTLIKLKEEHSKVLNENSYSDLLNNNRVCFGGTGSSKLKNILNHDNAFFAEINSTEQSAATLSHELFHHQKFSDLAYSHPFYLKPFYTG